MNKTHGVTENTPKSVMLGAGIVVKGLEFTQNAWKYASILGATSGGNKLTIEPEYQDLELDGVLVKTKGTVVKVGEKATLETNLAEVTAENLRMAVGGKAGTGVEGFDEIISKEQLSEDDYVEGLGYIGHTLAGDPIVVKFDYALCTSGLELEGKNKDQTVIKATFECCADMNQVNLNTLPYHIYTKTA